MGRRTALIAVCLLLAGCTTAWEKHEQMVAQSRASGDLAGELRAQSWLVQHSFVEAPPGERGVEQETDRLLTLGDLLGKTGRVSDALDVYREILRIEPKRAEDVLTAIGLLPVSQAQRNTYLDEFTQNALALDPGSPIQPRRRPACWSYEVHQIRIRTIWTTNGPRGLERHLNYDSRPWVYDASDDSWHVDGDWMRNAGAEIQPVRGPPNFLYRAIRDADGGFFTDGRVPPCHRAAWHGPYDTRWDKVFTARKLPRSRSISP